MAPPRTPPIGPNSARGTPGSGGPNGRGSSGLKRKDTCLEQIQLLQRKREERRRSMEEKRAERAAEEKRLTDQGMPGDVDFQRMIRDFRIVRGLEPGTHIPPGDLKICICVRKRPINDRERKRRDYDAVTCFNPVVMVHDCKLRVDGITKFLDNADFAFDHTFNENDTTEQVYHYTTAPLIPFIFQGGRATCFAYGQTGSGKTYTMAGIQEQAARDLFELLGIKTGATSVTGLPLTVYVSFFEIYGGQCQDLLNDRHRLLVREDGKGDVVIGEMEEIEARTVEELLGQIEEGNRNRTTHATEINDVSSRSHAICQIVLRHRHNGKMHGKLSLVDLAGSERGADSKSHNRQRRLESAEINKSLLALKECIRALDSESSHVPYRASKLTLVLKDCFAKEKARTVMIATVSPNASSADHTINTLRYADRVKEKNVDELNVQTHLHKSSRVTRLENEFREEAVVVSMEEMSGSSLELEGEDNNQHHRHSQSNSSSNHTEMVEDEVEVEKQMEVELLVSPRQRVVRARHGTTTRTQSNSDKSLPPPPPPPLPEPGKALPSENSSGEVLEERVAGKGKGGAGSPGKERDGSGKGRKGLGNEVKRNLRSSREVKEETEMIGSISPEMTWEEEEALLNLHMNVIQENAELLTEEGRLLQEVQNEETLEYDFDNYTQRLQGILERKLHLVGELRVKLIEFRGRQRSCGRGD